MVMKHYPPEFRAEAVALYRSRPGATIKSVAQDLGVNHETLRNWIRLDDAQRTEAPASTASASAPASPEDENAALRHQVQARRTRNHADRPHRPPPSVTRIGCDLLSRKCSVAYMMA
ncbi:transposase [Saccharothrix luteola]|uniref:transposase n=1 Tax=Saccharothrix luteola TaxID=2893018 RepID=UPI001E402257|nr:transposase [Saccharothrix luteola]MCC8250204.1 transposase [Saccharothrix luteola]